MAKRKKEPFLRVTKKADGSRTFTAQVRVREHSASMTFKTKDEAVAWHETKRKQFAGIDPEDMQDGATNSTIGELIESYLTHPDTLALKSIYDTKKRIAWFTNKYGRVKVLDFKRKYVAAAARALMSETKRTKITANRYLSVMRSCWNWGRAQGKVPDLQRWPDKVMYSEKATRYKRQRYLSVEELDGLIDTAKADPMVECGIVVAVTTGLRISEMLRLMWKDIDLVGGKLTVHTSKNDEPRKVHLPAPTVAAFKRLRAQIVGPTCCFPGPGKVKPITYSKFSRRWRAIRKEAGLKNFRWHDLRHSTASFLASKGASLPQIGSVLGHKSTQTTARYTHLTEGGALEQHSIFNEILK